MLTSNTGWTLTIKVDDEITTRTVFCIGEQLEFVCNHNTRVGPVMWTVSSFISHSQGKLSKSFPKFKVGHFTGKLNGRNFSTLEVVAFKGLNRKYLMCQEMLTGYAERIFIGVVGKCAIDI